MFKIQITAIKPGTPPRPYGGTSSLIPPHLAADGDRSIDATISIDSDSPERASAPPKGGRYGKATWTGKDAALLSDWITNQDGMYGHRVGESPNPLDAVAALTGATWLEWEIAEGAEILDMPREELPPGAVW
jgi:hypothetical protein